MAIPQATPTQASDTEPVKEFVEHDKEISDHNIEHIDRPRDIDHEAEHKIRVKVDFRLMPMLCVLLMVAYLDRTNIGNARIQGLEADLGMTGTDYNIALFVFFIPYIVLDVPLNILMKRLRPSLYLGTLCTSWGIVTVCQGVTQSYAGLIVCRVLLGCFEAGFLAGAIYMMAMYYTRYELHTRMSLWYSAGTLCGAFGGLLAYAIAHMDGTSGYSAWRWIFIIEGAFTTGVGILTFFVLPDWPEQARFLKDDERAILIAKLSRDTGEYVENKTTVEVLKETFTDPKILFCATMYFGTSVTGAASSFFLPSILRQFGWTSIKAQYMSIPVWLVAWILQIFNGFASDKVHRRWPFFFFPLCLSVIGYALLLGQRNLALGVRYMATFFVVSGCWAALAMTMTWLNNNSVGKKRRGVASAAILAIGNTGSIMGSFIFLAAEAPRYTTGYSVALVTVILAQTAATGYLFHAIHENKAKARGARDHLLALPESEQAELGSKHPSYRYTY
ncbi:hypothetical protein PV10_04683 [Exophiala mesophila]|uniref:Major facilitator superfamily (MFS) profile domain-containing protein n=1 Tax=Exophiala mesophila TaxID=212818 RepID=A0A0D1XZ19_EXOME|nr:uncharacterized protein PV10_04683 [Exophiala mesophila]KIV93471.1 hypothetical protein PV10_04683 [Exophiala mesophila]